MATRHPSSPAEPRLLGTLEARSIQRDDPESNYDISLWRSQENVCEHRDSGVCDIVAGVYYGSREDPVTKFCPRHFYEMHLGPNAAYDLRS
jgi:hypothetical protein